MRLAIKGAGSEPMGIPIICWNGRLLKLKKKKYLAEN